jgi:hypothetical protein
MKNDIVTRPKYINTELFDWVWVKFWLISSYFTRVSGFHERFQFFTSDSAKHFHEWKIEISSETLDTQVKYEKLNKTSRKPNPINLVNAF